MDSFSEWVNTADHPCFQEWGSVAVELGASWDSFRREDKEVIVQDLANGGIPILAARDMTAIASKEIVRSRAPMAVFWDLENMPIPSEISGRDITTSLKSILSPHGDLVQFRGYASIGLNQIPEEKRSDLQLSGIHLVDCPHHGRKEVADKMIIVDAMQFAFQHPDAATICLITGDADYAYLLATLQRPQWRTIVISRGTMQSMLHVNCDMKMRWETDILQPVYGGRNEDCESDGGVSESTNKGIDLFRPLSADEVWKDDVELLRTVIKQESRKQGILAPLKSQVGGILRNTNPARFPQRIKIQDFLAKAIKEGVVVERGERQYKTLCLPLHANHPSTIPSMKLSSKLPASFEHFPLKVVNMAKSIPFTILIRKSHCPAGEDPPNKVFVQSTTEWLFYMFHSYRAALDTVAAHSWLGYGTLVDIRQMEPLIPAPIPSFSQPASGVIFCSVCSNGTAPGGWIRSANSVFCSAECLKWTEYDCHRIAHCTELLLEVLKLLETYDDLYLQHLTLVRLLTQRDSKAFPSRGIAKAVIMAAETSGVIMAYKVKKNKFVALPGNCFTPMDYDADSSCLDEEVAFVEGILWEEVSGACVDRKTVNARLKGKFPLSMAQSYQRRQVYSNGFAQKKIFLARGPHNQMVGLSRKDAARAVDRATCDSVRESETTPPNDGECSSDESDDDAAMLTFARLKRK